MEYSVFILALVIYAFCGALAGFLAGLLGIGGGLVTVPALLFTFYLLDFPSPIIMQMAIGTSLASMTFTAASSAYAHYIKKGVRKDIVYLLAPGIFCGAVFGAIFAIYLSSQVLALMIGLAEILIGAAFLFSRYYEIKTFKDFHPVFLAVLGIPIGAFSTVLGIGGGLLTVPILICFRIPLHYAISTSAVTGFLIALIGAFAFLYPVFWLPSLQGVFGYLYVPAFIVIGITSSLFAPYGAQLAYRLTALILKRIFGIILLTVGVIITCLSLYSTF